MRLFIAEKPSLGRAIADVLPKPHRKAEGCIYVGNGDCVSWCVGHLLEQVEPDAYDARFKQWRLEHLPIVPEQWQLKPKASSRKQLSVLRQLIKQADQLIHAGDPDREGQLLVDQVIEYLNVSANKRATIQRCLISDLNPAAVSRAIKQLTDNKAFVPLSTSALARSRADWLYGINMTRALTLQGRKVGYQGVLSVGRVQTPLLGLVVRRDKEIESFVAKPFYQVFAQLETDKGEHFKAKWQPSEACAQWQDEEGRVIAKALAENVASRIADQPATVKASSRKVKQQPPPQLYNLSALQIDAAKRFSMSAKQVLDSCQRLYEQHKLLTYPRSDCRHLPQEHYADRDRVLAAIANNAQALAGAVSGADPSLKSKAWNDSKVSAHHAIIPTARQASTARLSSTERNIYELVARQYTAQFYPAHEYSDSQLDLEIGGGLFIAKARQSLLDGWKALYPSKKQPSPDTAVNQALPALKKGEHCHCIGGDVLEKLTTPPKPFDDASLLAAMTGVGRYVKDPEIRKVLKETDGLGTEATRAGIIELLFKRDFLRRQGKQIHATAAGKGLINSLPEVATLPDMTAQWETQLNAISQKALSYKGFMQPLQCSLGELVDQSQSVLPVGLKDIKAKPAFRKGRKRRVAAKKTSKTALAS
ncbi:DNA topoisomerase III [Oceanicoccus sagamiensis]|uniref:DNA topoisomerase 3 n=1 Tax=Oceanicoccus sagamiensis TaxID=716816 RepID=A0A1X9NJ22_9GAMM|nr:DNA topoisomerase III [Oceanicoccus sagamiensis]ARN76362.1 DNA topoisomerase III [Oceanicoccus sagamiensis]